jgi:hypothetical protein
MPVALTGGFASSPATFLSTPFDLFKFYKVG